MSAESLTNNANSCHKPPVPEVEIDILPGFFFAALTTSSGNGDVSGMKAMNLNM